jgi:amino acid transporter
LVFYKVSGGPFGCEGVVKTAGPFYAILGFAGFPLVWCLQEALVTAELGLAYLEPSGAIAWIEEAFGPCAGLFCGYLDWVSGATDNAIYPSLFLEYLLSYIGRGGETFLQHPLWCFCFSGVIFAALALINYMGLEVVGNLSIVVCVISMSPFLLLCIFGLPKVDPARWLVFPTGDIALSTKGDDEIVNSLGVDSFLPVITIGSVLWRPFVNSLFWNMNSFDVGASFAGEVQDPERVFPKAMFLSVSFVVFSYLLPVLIALGASDLVQSKWNAGY